MSRDAAALVDLLNAAVSVRRFAEGVDRDAFLRDEQKQSAIIHRMLVMGEAAKRLSDGFRQTHPLVPWQKITGMRDVLIHRYDEVDLREVWATVQRDLPALIDAIRAIASTDDSEAIP